MKKITLYIAILLHSVGVFAQKPPDMLWKKIPYETSETIGQRYFAGIGTKVGEYLLTGYHRESTDGSQLLLTKYNAKGDERKDILLTHPNWNGLRGWELAEASDGGFFIGIEGDHIDTTMPSFSILLLKTDAAGDTLWSATDDNGYRWARAAGILPTIDGGCIYLSNQAFSGFYFDNVVEKYSKDGVSEWRHVLSDTRDDRAFHIVGGEDGAFYLACLSVDENNIFKIAFLKSDQSGKYKWRHLYENTHQYFPWEFVRTTDGGFAIASSHPQNQNTILLKVNAEGIEQWRAHHDGEANTIIACPDNGVLISGIAFKPEKENGRDAFLAKFDKNGNEEWTAISEYPDSQGENIWQMIRNKQNNHVLLAGFTTVANTVAKGYVLCFDEEQTTISNYSIRYNNKLKILSVNQSNNVVNLHITLTKESAVEIEVYTVLGQRIGTMNKGQLTAGSHQLSWNIRDGHGNRISTGNYVFRISVDGQSTYKRFSILK